MVVEGGAAVVVVVVVVVGFLLGFGFGRGLALLGFGD